MGGAPGGLTGGVAATENGISEQNGAAITIVVVDDHTLVREGTVEILERDPALSVVGQCDSGEEAVELICGLQPDLALVDIELPGMTGIEVAREVQQRVAGTRFVVVSAYDDRAYVMEALAAGVSGYLLKTVSGKDLLNAVRSVAGGTVVLDEGVSRRLGEPGRPAACGPGQVQEKLTPRETDVLSLVAQGRSNRQIAAQLGVGVRTVESHVSNTLAKLGLRSRTEAALYCVDRNR